MEKVDIVTESWPPFNYLSDDGYIKGLASEVVIKVMEEANLEYTIELLSWKRGYHKAKYFQNVVIYTIFKTPEREPDFNWICPIMVTEGVKAFSLKQRTDIQVVQLEELKK